MKRFAIASIISCSLALAIAATSEPAASQPATQAAADTQPAVVGAPMDGQTLAVIKGKTILIQLYWNITTGYAWKLKSLKGDAVEQVGKFSYVANPRSRFVPGGGGKLLATFKAVKAGNGTIELVYVRQKEDNAAPVKTFTLRVKVEEPAATQPASKPAAESKPAEEDRPAGK
jgi:inhibitor of cysteine peptidase